MALPNVDVVVRDGGLGLAPNAAGGVVGIIGEAAEGDFLPRVLTRASQAEDLYGSGELAQAIEDALGAGAKSVIAHRLPAATPGEVESIEHEIAGYVAGVSADAGNTSSLDGPVSVLGTLVAAGTVLLKITTGGTAGEGAAFAYSADAGATWSDPIALSLLDPIVIGDNTLNLQWPTGTYVVDDAWTVSIAQGDGAVTVSGAPTSGGIVQVVIDSEGGRNVGTFKLLDGDDEELLGATTIPLSGEYEVGGLGITLSFSDGYYVADDTWGLTLTAPGSTVDQITEAALAIRNQSTPFEAILVCGETSPATWAALDVLAETEFRARGRYIYFIVEAPLPDDETEAEWVAERITEPALAGSLTRVVVVAGWIGEDDDVRSAAAAIVGHAMGLEKISYSAGRVRSGLVGGVTVFGPTDEGLIDQLDSAGFTTLRRWDGLSGAYVTNGRMAVDETSDFRWWEYRRVMDEACRQARLAGIRSAHDLGDVPGLIALEADMQAPLNVMVANRLAAGIQVTVPPDQPVVQTSQVTAEVAVQPVPSMRWITVDIGFTVQNEEG